MADKVYADGIFGSQRDDQKDFVVGKVAIVRERFVEWLDGVDVDARGYVRLNVTRQKANPTKWSFSLDTWVPKGEPKQEQQDDENLPW